MLSKLPTSQKEGWRPANANMSRCQKVTLVELKLNHHEGKTHILLYIV